MSWQTQFRRDFSWFILSIANHRLLDIVLYVKDPYMLVNWTDLKISCKVDFVDWWLHYSRKLKIDATLQIQKSSVWIWMITYTRALVLWWGHSRRKMVVLLVGATSGRPVLQKVVVYRESKFITETDCNARWNLVDATLLGCSSWGRRWQSQIEPL